MCLSFLLLYHLAPSGAIFLFTNTGFFGRPFGEADAKSHLVGDFFVSCH